MMKHLDSNGDGSVTLDEARQFAREAFRRNRGQRPGQGGQGQRPDGARPDRPQRPDGAPAPGTDNGTDRPQRPDRPDRPQRPEGAPEPGGPGTDGQRPDRPQRPEGGADRPNPLDRLFQAADEDHSGALTGEEIPKFLRSLHEMMQNRPQGQPGQGRGGRGGRGPGQGGQGGPGGQGQGGGEDF
ncbi:MAG: hypothetical protein AB7K09_23845 [Planctomycetota bacterium]